MLLSAAMFSELATPTETEVRQMFRSWTGSYCKRVLAAATRRAFGIEFDRVMSLGCKVIYRFDRDPKTVCLTFDDSPNPLSTPRVLESLKQQDVRATFYCIGRAVLSYPDVYRMIVAAGHEIGNHSMLHPDFWDSSPRLLRRDFEQSQSLLESAGITVSTFRAPYGHFRWDMRSAAKSVGIDALVGWDVAPRYDEQNHEAIASFILDRARAGSIIAMHDGLEQHPASEAIGKAAAAAIGVIVPTLRKKGLEFKTVSEALGTRNYLGLVAQ